MLQRLRESKLGCALREWVIPVLYPNFHEKIDTCVTEDERKLNDHALSTVRDLLNYARCHYFSMVVNRFLPRFAAKLDRLALKLLCPASYLLAGRFIVTRAQIDQGAPPVRWHNAHCRSENEHERRDSEQCNRQINRCRQRSKNLSRCSALGIGQASYLPNR
jgi:hypothetical protein